LGLLILSYFISLIFYLTKESDRYLSMSLAKELKFKMRTIATRITEAIYFIFILPHTTKHSQMVENSNTVLVSSYTATCSIIGLTSFMVYSFIIKEGHVWKLLAEEKGFWKDLGSASKGE